eukprot:5084971-Alexandrium_andersonii.AAC.1
MVMMMMHPRRGMAACKGCQRQGRVAPGTTPIARGPAAAMGVKLVQYPARAALPLRGGNTHRARPCRCDGRCVAQHPSRAARGAKHQHPLCSMSQHDEGHDDVKQVCSTETHQRCARKARPVGLRSQAPSTAHTRRG